MQQVADFFANLLGTESWPERWNCGTWSEFHGWLYIASDLGIWLAYFAIPVILIYFIQRRPDIPFMPVFWLFSAFIVLCGATHLIDAMIFWWPAYRLSALLRFVTAIVSFLTVFALIRDIPKALQLESPTSLAQEKDLRKQAETELTNNKKLIEEMFQEIEHRDQRIKRLEANINKALPK